MVSNLLTRHTARLLSASRPLPPIFKAACKPISSLPAARRRNFATASGTKEYTVRDALNEALAEELESNPKVFVLGEEVAQYNGA